MSNNRKKPVIKDNKRIYTKKQKVSTNLRLEAITLGYLRYMVKMDEADTFFELVDALVAAYVEHFAMERNLNILDIDRKAMQLFENSRQTRKVLTVEAQKEKARLVVKEMKKQEVTPTAADYRKIQKGVLKGDY